MQSNDIILGMTGANIRKQMDNMLLLVLNRASLKSYLLIRLDYKNLPEDGRTHTESQC